MLVTQPSLAVKRAFSDNFGRADSTTSVGPMWVQHGANAMGISSNKAYVVGTSVTGAVSYLYPLATDTPKVSATLNGSWSGTSLVYVFIAAGSDMLAYAYVQATGISIYSSALWGGGTSRASAGGLTIASGDVISIERSGTTYTARQNGTSRVTWNDSGGIVPVDARHRMVGIGGYHTTTTRMDIFAFTAADM